MRALQFAVLWLFVLLAVMLGTVATTEWARGNHVAALFLGVGLLPPVLIVFASAVAAWWGQ